MSSFFGKSIQNGYTRKNEVITLGESGKNPYVDQGNFPNELEKNSWTHGRFSLVRRETIGRKGVDTGSNSREAG